MHPNLEFEILKVESQNSQVIFILKINPTITKMGELDNNKRFLISSTDSVFLYLIWYFNVEYMVFVYNV
jgi:hypothetical protein